MTSTVTLVGTTGRDPELRFTPNGTPVANFSMAVNRRWKSKTTDQWEESTSWFNVVCWSDLGLRWATAEIQRNERSSSSSGGGGQAPAGYSPEEEPF